MELNCSILKFVPAGPRLRGAEGLYGAYKVFAGEVPLGNVSGASAAEVRKAGVALLVASEWPKIGKIVYENSVRAMAENREWIANMFGPEAVAPVA